VSEFGNLNQDSSPWEEELVPVVTPRSPKDKMKKNNALFIRYYQDVEQYINYYDDLSIAMEEIRIKHTTDNLLDFYPFKSEFNKLLQKKKKEIFNECFKLTENLSNRVAKKAVGQYKKWLQEQIYDSNDLSFNYKSKWSHIKQKNQVFKTDYETARMDRLEQEYCDK